MECTLKRIPKWLVEEYGLVFSNCKDCGQALYRFYYVSAVLHSYKVAHSFLEVGEGLKILLVQETTIQQLDATSSDTEGGGCRIVRKILL